jgi:hypothetical protein
VFPGLMGLVFIPAAFSLILTGLMVYDLSVGTWKPAEQNSDKL